MTTPHTLPPKNHNNPPSDIELLENRLTLDHVTLIRQAEEHEQFSLKIPSVFTEDGEAAFTGDYIKRVKECQKQIETIRVLEKEPFLTQGKFVDSYFGDYKTKLEVAITRANAPLTAYLTKKAEEEKAIRDKEAKQLADEQAAAFKEAAEIGNSSASEEVKTQIIEHAVNMSNVADTAKTIAAAPLTSMASSKGKYSASNLVEQWSGVITDMETLDIRKLKPYFTAKEIQNAVDKYVKQGGRQCEGVKIDKTITTKVK